ncbi:hypothetical protein U2A4042630039 [Corynebacterium striatum]|nr:hypothetical protein U2A4042630039 [Corynebacterium striatum]
MGDWCYCYLIPLPGQPSGTAVPMFDICIWWLFTVVASVAASQSVAEVILRCLPGG